MKVASAIQSLMNAVALMHAKEKEEELLIQLCRTIHAVIGDSCEKVDFTKSLALAVHLPVEALTFKNMSAQLEKYHACQIIPKSVVNLKVLARFAEKQPELRVCYPSILRLLQAQSDLLKKWLRELHHLVGEQAAEAVAVAFAPHQRQMHRSMLVQIMGFGQFCAEEQDSQLGQAVQTLQTALELIESRMIAALDTLRDMGERLDAAVPEAEPVGLAADSTHPALLELRGNYYRLQAPPENQLVGESLQQDLRRDLTIVKEPISLDTWQMYLTMLKRFIPNGSQAKMAAFNLLCEQHHQRPAYLINHLIQGACDLSTFANDPYKFQHIRVKQRMNYSVVDNSLCYEAFAYQLDLKYMETETEEEQVLSMPLAITARFKLTNQGFYLLGLQNDSTQAMKAFVDACILGDTEKAVVGLESLFAKLLPAQQIKAMQNN